MKKVELLAPAGNYESFLGAVHAGADAVYIGGRKYGARAYAGNFSDEEVCLAIRYAHLRGVKLYLTVNTLLRDDELNGLYDYLLLFYREGLDGVIIQDIGVFLYVREQFPGLELHASTQMTITGADGAQLLKDMGASRLVPARELSLEEIRSIKEKVDIEVETFIHGAMCYCYSGQCLFSSMLGERSGNRGRCAQPCRLPYCQPGKKGGKEEYPLSLKDMCTLSMIPQLIEAGIDSFKIEGRMKKPEYAAGVTALYRKYIDDFYYYREEKRDWNVSREDIEKLMRLYIRSEIQEGYYNRHNGKEMITPDKPSYMGVDEAYLAQIRETYIEKRKKIPITGRVRLQPQKPAVLTVCREKICVTAKGQDVQKAQSSPLTEETVRKQLCKTGNTDFDMVELAVELEGDVFLPVKFLNDLRRQALEKLEAALLAGTFRKTPTGPRTIFKKQGTRKNVRPYLAVEVEDEAGFLAAAGTGYADRIYLSADCVLGKRGVRILKKAALIKREKPAFSFWLSLPRVIRARDAGFLEQLRTLLNNQGEIDGLLIRSLESISWLRRIGYSGCIQADCGLYVWNQYAKAFWKGQDAGMSAPLELTERELERLGTEDMEVLAYGRIPMMVTANCVKRTMELCEAGREGDRAQYRYLQDRYQKRLPVEINCVHCYNVIYNSVPLSLHHCGQYLSKSGKAGIRLAFTTESPEEIKALTACFRELADCGTGGDRFPFEDYTKGHFRRGVE